MEMNWDELPEEYRDPAKIKEALALVQATAKYKDFYEKQYEPWLAEHGTTFQEYSRDADDFRKWKGEQGKRPAGEPGQPIRSEPEPTSINFDDPDAVEKTYQTLHNEIGQMRSAYETEITGLKSALENERTNVYQLIALQEQAYGLLNSELYDHLDWKPTTNIRDVASYAKDHGLADLTEAAQQLYRSGREKAIEQAAYDRAKRDLEQQSRNETVTTEMGSGTPLPDIRRAPPQGYVRGDRQATQDAMMRAIAERRAARRMATS